VEEAAKKVDGLNIPLGLDVLGGPSAGRIAQLLTPGGKLVVYGGVTLKPMELPALALIGKRLTVVAFFESYPDMYAKVGPALRKLVKYLRPDGPKQPVAAVYTLDRLKDAVEHAVTGTKVLLQFDGAA